MIARAYRWLPGPAPLRVAVMIVATVAALIALLFVYEWVGTTFIDPTFG
ncbi:hypothetical protein HQ535_10970 [bacterium]|nr:hypothetical protein [bacterium]